MLKKCMLPRSTASLNACRMVAILNAGLNLQTCVIHENRNQNKKGVDIIYIDKGKKH